MAARLRPTPDEPHTRLKQVSLFSPTRVAILDAVQAEPGLSASETARRIGRDPSTIWNNAHLLVQAGLIRIEREGRRLRIYPTSGLTPEERFLARLGPSAVVYEAIKNGAPGRALPIAHACGITRHAARYHLTRLARLGALRIVEQRKLVTERVYWIVDTKVEWRGAALE